MDRLVTTTHEAKEAAGFSGTSEEFKCSSALVDWCIRTGKIVRLAPQDMPKSEKERYTDFLVGVMRRYLRDNPDVTRWSDFSSRPENRKVQALFHQFGVRGEVFGIEGFTGEELPGPERSKTNITIEEFYEVCQIQFHYQGSLGSFKKLIARKYGSFAEYCITKGYDINGTKWESDETALRVARRLGSIEAIQARARTLYKYLLDRGMLDKVFTSAAS